jgi:epoxide hydrolase
LMDSPVGLAAWIVEKYRAWSDCDGDIETRFTKDELLTNLTIYWVTGTIGSANRIYAETRRAGFGASLPDAKVPVPMGYVKFPGDAFKPPRRWVEQLYDVRRWSEVDEGGHFPALEVPELLSAEIRQFFAGLE